MQSHSVWQTVQLQSTEFSLHVAALHPAQKRSAWFASVQSASALFNGLPHLFSTLHTAHPNGSSVTDSLENIPVPTVTSSNMSTLFFFVFSHIGLSRGALVEDWRPPLDNLTALQKTIAPPWVSSPRTRGTFEILYSCSFTLALYVYTAIRLNVPPREDTRFWFYLRKYKWVLIALFVPEVVLYAAWVQFHQATVFCRKYNRLMRRPTSQSASAIQVSGNNEPESRLDVISKDKATETSAKDLAGTEEQPRILTLADGFYAVMGGYVILGHPTGRYTLSPDQVISMVELEGYPFPIVDRETIKDKDKANLLSVLLFFFQVSFLIIQVGCVSSPQGSCC